MDHQFRNAAFGGFNKQDVLDYLELIAREHREQLQQLQDELAQTQQRCSDLLENESQCSAQVKKLGQETQHLQQAQAKIQVELEQAQRDNAALHTQLSEKDAVCSQLEKQVAQLRPDAEAYAAVKERSAGVELDAHRRAQGILDQAHAEAQQVQAQVQQWLSRVEREYSSLRTQVDATLSHTAGELDKVSRTLDQITQCLAQQDTALEELEKVYSESASAKVPAPMPIPEE